MIYNKICNRLDQPSIMHSMWGGLCTVVAVVKLFEVMVGNLVTCGDF